MTTGAPKPGEVFAIPLGDGRFAAVRVLRVSETTEGPSALVAVTSWLGSRLPDIHATELREILCRHRGHFRGRPAICWYSGAPPEGFEYVGVIKPTTEELEMDPQGAYCGSWDRSMGLEVLLERGEQAAQSTSHPSAGSPIADDLTFGEISEDDFWQAIGLLDWDAETNSERVEPLVRHLSQLSTRRIAGFQEKLAEKLFALDGAAFAREIGEFSLDSPEGFSPDHFVDVRCAVIANGKTFYNSVLDDPRMMPKNTEFEPLLGVAEEAYRLKTGRLPLFAGIKEYATYSNEAGWRIRAKPESPDALNETS